MAMLQLDDVTLHYEQEGDGEPTLVFVHGMGGGAWVWEDQVNRLSDRFTCVTYDRRGHSRSRPRGGDQSLATHVADLRALIETLELDRPVVVGSSAGGAITTELAHRWPDLVRGVVLSEPALFGLDPSAAETIFGAIRRPVEEAMQHGGPREAIEAFLGVVCAGLWERLDDRRREAYRDNGELLMPTLEAVGSTLALDDVAAITVPACVVAGGDSLPVGRSLTQLIARTLPDARYVELEGASHATYVDAPEGFAQAVSAFAREVAGTVQTA
ncbi:MAG TPA: alpha/beta hydrolase [Acidimicrobiales bacterium]